MPSFYESMDSFGLMAASLLYSLFIWGTCEKYPSQTDPRAYKTLYNMLPMNNHVCIWSHFDSVGHFNLLVLLSSDLINFMMEVRKTINTIKSGLDMGERNMMCVGQQIILNPTTKNITTSFLSETVRNDFGRKYPQTITKSLRNFLNPKAIIYLEY